MLVVDNADAIRGIAEVASKLDFTVNGYVGTTATQLADGQLANAEGDLYASGADATVVTSITVVNTDSVARTFTLYLKPSAGTSRAISPVSLDLGIGHSFYTDGQRMVTVDAAGQILSAWAVDATPVDGILHRPISSDWSYDHEESAAKHLDKLMTTKGDIVSYSTVPARLGVGTNDQALVADSAQTTGLKWALVGGTKEFLAPVTYSSAMGAQGDFAAGVLISSGQYAVISFKVPHDFVSVTSVEIITIPRATQAEANWDIASDYAAEGEAYNTNSEADTDSTYNVTANQIYAVDISGILSDLAINDYVGINVELSDSAHDVAVLGVRLKYS